MPIKVGEKAPDFVLKGGDGKEYKLSDYKGKNVFLAFYPADFSPVCSQEHACFINDLKRFESLNAVIFGISVDSVWSHKAFAEKLKLTYPLLSDFHRKGEVASRYGLYLKDLGITNRATVIIDKQGIVQYVKVYDIPQARDNQELIEQLEKLK
ncbi:MAG TPA: peroxiredoxin [candidate division Zixibacteria bacterium]